MKGAHKIFLASLMSLTLFTGVLSNVLASESRALDPETETVTRIYTGLERAKVTHTATATIYPLDKAVKGSHSYTKNIPIGADYDENYFNWVTTSTTCTSRVSVTFYLATGNTTTPKGEITFAP